VASARLPENRFRKISGYRDLWALTTILRPKTETEIAQEKAYSESPVVSFSVVAWYKFGLGQSLIRCFANMGTDFSITEV
jgi:hypothetical protein